MVPLSSQRHGPASWRCKGDPSLWEEEANSYIAPVLGLPELPFVNWSSPHPTPADGVFWKTPEIAAWAGARPFAWLDDQITEADHSWLATHHTGPALLHWIDPRAGLQAEDFAALRSWAENLGSDS